MPREFVSTQQARFDLYGLGFVYEARVSLSSPEDADVDRERVSDEESGHGRPDVYATLPETTLRRLQGICIEQARADSVMVEERARSTRYDMDEERGMDRRRGLES